MTDGSKYEQELIVRDYFLMLEKELYGKSFNKTEHRINLKNVLSNRPDGSIEYKH